MAWRKYINGMALGALIFSLALVFILNFTTPEMGAVSYGSFFISLFLLLVCFTTIVGFYIRRKASNNEIIFRNLKSAFRQGTLIALYFTVLMIMRAANLLNWWDAALLAVSVIAFDMFFKEKV
jgi:Na+/alanine symporter